MKNVKRIAAVLLVIIIVAAAFAGCKPNETKEPDKTSKGSEIALIITNTGTIDDKSFNQGAWEGVKKYASETEATYKYYQPLEETTDAYLNAMALAVKNGAKVIITPGYPFEASVYQAQDLYPDVKFIILDGTPQDGTYTDYRMEKNVHSIFYAEEQAGFLAGYAAVKDGYRKLGFVGGQAVPAVVKYGYGYIQGADYAAKELKIKDISIKYTYTGNFEATPENQTLAASLYQGGTEIIFSCGGTVGNSVMAAAEQTGKKVIGVDVDQSSESNSVVTSAMKNLSLSVYEALNQYKDSAFKGGETVTLTLKDDGVMIEMKNARFNQFKEEEYNNICQKLKEDKDGITSSILKDTDVKTADKLPVDNVKVEIVGS